MIGAKPFIELLKRASKCRYRTLLLHNRMLMQSYNLANNSDIGLHYILPIPDTPAYDDKFYDLELVIIPSKILDTYKRGHVVVDNLRKDRKLKPKDLKEELAVNEFDKDVRLKFSYFLQDELIMTNEVWVDKIDENDEDSINLVRTYQALYERVKVGGIALTYNGIRLNLQDRIYNCPEIYFYKAYVGKKMIRIPFSKSIFIGLTKLTKFEFTVVETEIQDVYVYTIVFGKGDIEEIFWGYILNY